jgi:hypothetical protein
MYLHIGGNNVIPTQDILMIVNLETVEHSQITKEFMSLQKSEKKVIDISDGQPKSFVLTKEKSYLSPIASTTLKKRANFIHHLDL